jgi:hypothetical protein
MASARKMPSVLWVLIVAMGAISVVELVVGLRQASSQLLVSAVLNVVLIYGAARGHKWAYVLVLVFGLLGIIVAAGHSAGLAVGVLIGNGLVLVPLLISTRYFFPAAGRARPPVQDVDV